MLQHSTFNPQPMRKANFARTSAGEAPGLNQVFLPDCGSHRKCEPVFTVYYFLLCFGRPEWAARSLFSLALNPQPHLSTWETNSVPILRHVLDLLSLIHVGWRTWPESEPSSNILTYPAAGQFERFLRAITFLTGEPLPDPLGDGEFKCPECGLPNPTWKPWSNPPGDKSPWGMVLQRVSCRKCHYYIPVHIAHRWDNSSYEQAVADYRADAPRPLRRTNLLA